MTLPVKGSAIAGGPESQWHERPGVVRFGRNVCGDLEAAERREWLVTNGIGGYGSGTVAGVNTRRYHGLLVAALDPPLGRTLLVSRVEETATYDGAVAPLFTNRWQGGVVDPPGFRHIESFRLEGTVPVWRFAVGDALLEKRVWMARGSNTICVRYELVRARRNLELRGNVVVNCRDHHALGDSAARRLFVRPCDGGLAVEVEEAERFYLSGGQAIWRAESLWLERNDLPMERERGFPAAEDHFLAGMFALSLEPGKGATIVATTDQQIAATAPTVDAVAQREDHLLERFRLGRMSTTRIGKDRRQGANGRPSGTTAAPGWVRQLVLAADQFVVDRRLSDGGDGHTVIAGYPWFGDWGRDTMISLPGLLLATGRPELARSILATFADFVDQGMLPNRFADEDGKAEYNTVDATLWYFEALRQYHAATGDDQLVEELYPVLGGIINAHETGTRYGIHAAADGLLWAGHEGVQLTWMDAKVGDWVVTPRIGKPVEINALWLNALASQSRFAEIVGADPVRYLESAARVREGFQRFWNSGRDCCYDVIDGPSGNDAALRPNQIFAVSLPETGLTVQQQRQVVDTCAAHLLTSYGLRSLAPGEPDYVPRYEGGPGNRDAAYHQGTVWGWLLGPFAIAHLRVHGDAGAAATFLAPMQDHVQAHAVGTASEIFDAEPPHTARGAVAQAWTVAEVLRAWVEISDAQSPSPD